MAPVFCRLVLGSPEAAATAADAAAPGVDRIDEVAGAWLACRPELERRRGALAWGETASGQSQDVVAGLAALGELERAAVAAQALGLEPREIEQALGAEPGTARGLLSRAHARLAGLAGAADAACVRERERLAYAPAARRSTRADHCAKCRAFRLAVDQQRLELRRAAGGEPVGPAPPPGRAKAASPVTGPGPDAGPAEAGPATPRPAETAEPVAASARRAEIAAKPAAAPGGRRKAAKGVGTLRVRTEAAKALEALRRRIDDAKSRGVRRRRGDAPSEGGLPAPARAGGGSRVSPLVAGLRRRLEPEGRGPRIAVAVAVVLGSGLAGFGAVNALETPRQGGGDPGVVTATPVGPLPPGVGPTEP